MYYYPGYYPYYRNNYYPPYPYYSWFMNQNSSVNQIMHNAGYMAGVSQIAYSNNFMPYYR